MDRERYPMEIPYTPITQGFLISSQEYQKFLLSSELTNHYSRDSYILSIYALYPRLSRITSYPIHFSVVYKLHLEIRQNSIDIHHSLSQMFQKYTIIHTTGISKHGDFFSVEYYLSSEESWDTIKKLIDSFKVQDHIEFCEGEVIHYQDHIKQG